MDANRVKEAKKRADEVVNGFKKATTQNARDAQNLAEFVTLQERRITALKSKILADENATSNKSNEIGDLLKSMGL